MKISDVIETVEGTLICGEDVEVQLDHAFASDLMSDVLTINTDGVLLITGLSTVQTIRTAIVADIGAILFVRNKQITDDMRELARQSGIVLIGTGASMFRASGLLYTAGLRPVY